MVFRVRLVWLIGQAVTYGVVFGCAFGVLAARLGRTGWAPVAAPLGFIVGALIAVANVRGRHLVADATGLVATRDGYEVRARWADIVGFEQTRFAAILPVTILRLSDADVAPSGRHIMESGQREKISESGADRAIRISTYVKHPKTGRFGDLLRQHRPDLAMQA